MMNNNMMNSNFATPPPQNNFNPNGAGMQNFTPPQDAKQYQSFKIGASPEYNLNGGNMHVMTEQFGQGILLKHDLSTRSCLVQLARDHDGVNQIWLPGSQITLHTQHRVVSFEEFMREEEMRAQDAANAGNQGFGGNKRQRDIANNELHNTNFHNASSHNAARRAGY